MGKTVGYAFFSCTLAYVLAAILLFIFSIEQTGWSRIDNDIVTFLPSFLTLALSEFQWWGNFYYLAILVPWLGSSLVMMLLMRWFKDGVRRRRLLGGLSILAYYFVMFLVFIIHGLIHGWGDVGYYLFPLWLVGGFIMGYVAAIIVERVLKPQFAD